MHKIASNGATVDNKFTEGNLALSVPATIVDAAWLNAVQEEMCSLITRYGVALKTPGTETYDQLFTVIELLYKLGGRVSPILQLLANNQASAADVVGFPQFDSTLVQSFEFLFTIVRTTDTGYLKESGRAYISYDAVNGWEISRVSGFDGGGVTLVATVVSGTNYKLQYKTTNLTGSSYVGKLRITDIKMVAV